MIEELRRLCGDALARIASATTLDALDVVDTELLGKRAALAGLKRQLGSLAPEQRREVGQALNETQRTVSTAWPSAGRSCWPATGARPSTPSGST
ncbi:MAG: hypothetical protein WKF43_15745 [Acidimicrobiales bacterium]